MIHFRIKNSKSRVDKSQMFNLRTSRFLTFLPNFSSFSLFPPFSLIFSIFSIFSRFLANFSWGGGRGTLPHLDPPSGYATGWSPQQGKKESLVEVRLSRGRGGGWLWSSVRGQFKNELSSIQHVQLYERVEFHCFGLVLE